MKFEIKRKRKILCITRPETVLRAFARLSPRSANLTRTRKRTVSGLVI
jgi:hypothetical protein